MQRLVHVNGRCQIKQIWWQVWGLAQSAYTGRGGFRMFFWFPEAQNSCPAPLSVTFDIGRCSLVSSHRSTNSSRAFVSSSQTSHVFPEVRIKLRWLNPNHWMRKRLVARYRANSCGPIPRGR